MIRIAAAILAGVLGASTAAQAPPPPSADALVRAQSLMARSTAKSSRHDYAGAIADLDQAIAICSGCFSAYIDRALAKSSQFNYTGAIADASQALAVAATPSQKAQALLARARHKESYGDYDGAIADTQQAGSLAPTLYLEETLSGFEARKGDRKTALEGLDRAIAAQPALASLYRQRAEVRRGLGDSPGADQDLAMARALAAAYPVSGAAAAHAPDPVLPAPMQAIVAALAFRESGNFSMLRRHDFAGAIADFSHALELRPDDSTCLVGRARAKGDLGDRDGARADASRALAVADTPERRLSAMLAQSNAAAAAGDYDAALAGWMQARQLEPDTSFWFYQLALLKQGKGDHPKALDAVNQALALEPLMVVYYRRRAEVRRGLADAVGAQADEQLAARLNIAANPANADGGT